MSRCDEIQNRLMLALSSADEQGVRRHLDECDLCSGFFADLCALEELTRDLASTHAVPRNFHGAVMSRLPRHRLARSVATYALLPLLLAASVFVFGSFGGPDDSKSLSPSAQVLDDLLLPAESEPQNYVDVVIEDPVRGKVIIRVPSVIHVQRTSEAQDFYVHNVGF